MPARDRSVKGVGGWIDRRTVEAFGLDELERGVPEAGITRVA